MSAVPEQASVVADRSRRRGVSNSVRFLVSLFVAMLIAGAQLVDALARVQLYLPAIVLKFLHLPGYLYCEYVRATDPLPVDERSIFEMGQTIMCWFVGIVLGIPYHTLLIFGAWWLVDRLRRREYTANVLK
jgi:hypothetical protein